jgi:hypothetical protein
MAVLHTETVGTTDYGFDWADSEIEVEAGVASSTTADLKTACRRAEASEVGIVFDDIIDTSNPVTLTATSSTFLVVKLLALWKILTLSVSGSYTVQDGNTVHETDGVDIFAPNGLVSCVNNISAAGTYTQVAEVQEMHQDMGLKAGAPVTITENVAGTSYDQDSSGIAKEIRTSGSAKTVTRV